MFGFDFLAVSVSTSGLFHRCRFTRLPRVRVGEVKIRQNGGFSLKFFCDCVRKVFHGSGMDYRFPNVSEIANFGTKNR